MSRFTIAPVGFDAAPFGAKPQTEQVHPGFAKKTVVDAGPAFHADLLLNRHFSHLDWRSICSTLKKDEQTPDSPSAISVMGKYPEPFLRFGYLPTPKKNELLYGIFATFTARMGLNNATVAKIFGGQGFQTSLDLPTRIESALAHFPGMGLSADYFIENHTLYPLHAAFSSEARRSRLQLEMRGEVKGRHVPILKTSRLSTLRFCPICAKTTLNEESYWHRLHQAPGVEVCPLHRVFLEESSARREITPNTSRFTPASIACPRTVPRKLDATNTEHRILLRIAEDVDWILTHHPQPKSDEWLAIKYRDLMASHNLNLQSGQKAVLALNKAFVDFFSASLLDRLGTGLCFKFDTWLTHLLRDRGIPQHPLRHLLLIQFFGETAESLFHSENPPRIQFGNPPWPCFNPICPTFPERSIQEFTCKHSCGSLLGIFRCDVCGFEYDWRGSTEPVENAVSEETIHVRDRGFLFRDRVMALLEDRTTSLKAIATALRTPPWIIVAYVRRYRLRDQVVRGGSDAVSEVRSPQSAPLDPREERLERQRAKIEELKNSWLVIRAKHPDLTRSDLRHTHKNLYEALLYHDSGWLKAHLPPKQKGGRLIPKGFWRKKDEDAVRQLNAAAHRFLREETTPKRVTKRALAGLMKCPWYLKKDYRQHLPEASQLLTNLVESIEAFTFRRMLFTAKVWRDQARSFTLNKLFYKLDVVHWLRYSTDFRRKVEMALKKDGFLI